MGANASMAQASFGILPANVLIMGHAKNGNKIYVSHEKRSYDAPADTILFTTVTVDGQGG